MRALKDLFEHGIRNVYSLEQQLLAVFQDMEDESANKAVRRAFAHHREQTAEQIKRLDAVLEQVQVRPERRPSPLVDALLREKEAFVAGAPTDDLLDCYNVLAALQAEHLESAAYDGLIEVAEKLRLLDVAHHLRANLDEERTFVNRLRRLLRTFEVDFQQTGGVLQPPAPSGPPSP